MNWIWIVLLLCCCQNRGNQEESCGCNNMIQPRRDSGYGRSRCESERDFPRQPFAPEERRGERDRDCGCRASEIEQDDCNI